MTPVIQQDRTGCAMACIAALTGRKYATVKREAAKLGLAVGDTKLWTDTAYVRRLLARFSVSSGEKEEDFISWNALPDCALLAIKWHLERTGAAWHWVVFARDATNSYVLDPKKALQSHRRTDFGRMKPKWFIPIKSGRAPARVRQAKSGCKRNDTTSTKD